MKKASRKFLYLSLIFLTAFILWTKLITIIDVKAIGPKGSSVGFATINSCFLEITGVNMHLYTITDWLGLVPIIFAFGFGILGLLQWIKRRNILKVDGSILTLGVFYIATMAVYILFEYLVINYRPVLINGYLEASYPSSTTMLVMCVMLTAIIQLNARIKNNVLKRFVASTIIAFIVFMVIGRLVSGVHWITDIIGGALLSTGLVLIYRAIISWKVK